MYIFLTKNEKFKWTRSFQIPLLKYLYYDLYMKFIFYLQKNNEISKNTK